MPFKSPGQERYIRAKAAEGRPWAKRFASHSKGSPMSRKQAIKQNISVGKGRGKPRFTPFAPTSKEKRNYLVGRSFGNQGLKSEKAMGKLTIAPKARRRYR